MSILERHRQRQAKQVALIHSMEANGEAPTEPLGIDGRAVVAAVCAGIGAVIAWLFGG
jgi:hypothetical protein